MHIEISSLSTFSPLDIFKSTLLRVLGRPNSGRHNQDTQAACAQLSTQLDDAPITTSSHLNRLERKNVGDATSVHVPGIEPLWKIVTEKIWRNLRSQESLKNNMLTPIYDVVWSLLNAGSPKEQESLVRSAVAEIVRKHPDAPIMLRLNTFQFYKEKRKEQLFNKKEYERTLQFLHKLKVEFPTIFVAVEIAPYHTDPATPLQLVEKMRRILGDTFDVGFEIDLKHLYDRHHGNVEDALNELRELLQHQTIPVHNISISPIGVHHSGVEGSVKYLQRAIEVVFEAHENGQWKTPYFIIEPKSTELHEMIRHAPDLLRQFLPKSREMH